MNQVTNIEEDKTDDTAKRKSVLIGVHCSTKLVRGLDEYIRDQYDLMRRPEAIRKILSEHLGQQGYLQKTTDENLKV